VNVSPANLTLWHTGPSPLNCSIGVTNATSTVILPVNQTLAAMTNMSANRTLPPGAYTAIGVCHSPFGPVMEQKTFTVTGANTTSNATNATAPKLSYGITVLSPLGNTTKNVFVSYRHNITPDANCSVKLDGAVTDTPRTLDEDETRSFNRTLPLGKHTLAFTCNNKTLTVKANRTFTVLEKLSEVEGDESLLITPKTAFPGMNVTIEGEFPAYTTATFTVKQPIGTVTLTADVEKDGVGTVVYQVRKDAKLGKYSVTATSDGMEEGERLNGTFIVKKRNQTIAFSGNPDNLTLPFTVTGKEFVEETKVTLSLVGGGTTLTNETLADDAGAFAFTYKGVPAGSYTFTAKSASDSTVLAVRKIVVYVPPKTQATVKNDTPPKWEEPAPEEDTDDVDVPVYTPPPEPKPRPTPTYDDDPEPPVLESPGLLSGVWGWVLIATVLLVLVGGFVGYLAYNGSLDLSSVDAFKESLARLTGKEAPGSGGAAYTAASAHPSSFESDFGSRQAAMSAPVSDADVETIKGFIFGERGKGFDDLTIRSALLGKGWEKAEVDHVFDLIYKG
jgi:hypothetical protein